MSLKQGKRDRRNLRSGLILALVVAAMVGLAYASVPLYRIFCQVTGFAGTPTRSGEAPGAIGEDIPIRFDASTAPGLPWRFHQVENTRRVRIGERNIALYTATNLSGRPVTGTATFNVTPLRAGQYFSKIECFCFTEQTLQPGQEVQMPVVFYVDPSIRTDPQAQTIREITLSYTFFPAGAGTTRE